MWSRIPESESDGPRRRVTEREDMERSFSIVMVLHLVINFLDI